MKNQSKNKQHSISSEELLKFYNNQSKVEQQKKDSRERVMENQLHKVTGGKSLVLSNCQK